MTQQPYKNTRKGLVVSHLIYLKMKIRDPSFHNFFIPRLHHFLQFFQMNQFYFWGILILRYC
jgi:hypothetical protein